jgi:hypothetical protein
MEDWLVKNVPINAFVVEAVVSYFPEFQTINIRGTNYLFKIDCRKCSQINKNS